MNQKELEEIIEELRGFTTSELCDGAEAYQTMDYPIKRRVSDKKIVGPAFTVDPPKGVSGIVPDAILQAKPGDVLVIAGKECCNHSYWGDHRSLCASMKGLEGVVIDGAFRDLEGCEEVDFPIFARTVTPGSCKKEAEGVLGVPVDCGGVRVNPGDLIIGDCNGVLVIRLEEAKQIMERAKQKVLAQYQVVEEMKATGKIIPRVKVHSLSE